MKLSELEALFREQADDTAKPYLWGEALVTAYLNEAEGEACIRARLLADATTPDVCEIPVTAGEAIYSAHPAVFRVTRAKLDGQPSVLQFRSKEMLDRDCPGWEVLKGTPTTWTWLEYPKLIQLIPAPAADTTLRLVVNRLPLRPMSGPDDKPAIPEFYHQKLVAWALHRAFSRRDADTYDEARSGAYAAEFERDFGQRPTANQLRMQNVGSDWTTRP